MGVKILCPRCRGKLRRHCMSKVCNWWLCPDDQAAWVLIVKRNGNEKPTWTWRMPTHYPEPMGPLPEDK